jgi:iron(III) transport system ATP-binding protein
MQVGISQLELSYGDHSAIKKLDLTIADGQSVVLLGQSGCGKTSTMRCLAGLESPNGGTITIGDTTVFDARRGKVVPPHRRNVGMVFQSYAVWPHRTVLENVAFPLKMKGIAHSKRRAQALGVLDVVGLAHLADRSASLLSGGQMQRVALARSMAMEPGVLLLDEPLSNLDARLRDDLRVELRRIQVERGLTSLYVTHDQQEALALADRIAIMQEGRITQSGPPEEIYHSPASASIAKFLGVTNIFAASSSQDAPGVRLSGHDVVFASDSSVPAGPSSVCVRPEDIVVDTAPAPQAPSDPMGVNAFTCTVDVAVFQGASIRCKLTTDSGMKLEAICPPPATGSLSVGSRAVARVHPRHVRVLPDQVEAPSPLEAIAA